jgi:hypothetical protein
LNKLGDGRSKEAFRDGLKGAEQQGRRLLQLMEGFLQGDPKLIAYRYISLSFTDSRYQELRENAEKRGCMLPGQSSLIVLGSYPFHKSIPTSPAGKGTRYIQFYVPYRPEIYRIESC